ncbi:zinc-dependent alcohol dehydrogenase family protein [Citricoccus sp.]|uniref:zinc-dependent alcohol dehydrogenase family protein n=1 Tax=Citricoccus sp. TaxID=1978372 RepID=UPI00261A93D5|nr:zinc-dependent alcohol dehydrogenase family protein [Citricoccus sp.]HRO31302.1 zinc-dependent alcohol dehydrogenase family protein [Citricoccus sp.]
MTHAGTGLIARSFGDPLQVLQLATVDPQPVRRGQAAVRMIASPINPSDLIPVTGAYASRTALPFIPGFEGVGVVEALGGPSGGLRVGQRVLPIGSAGGWQSTKVLDADWCVSVPDDLDDAAAATAYINPLTALRMVQLHASTGDVRTAAVNAAGSSIAQIIARLLQQRGIRTIGLGRHPQPEDQHQAGYWTEYLHLPAGHAERQLEEDDRLSGVDVVFDCVGGAQGTALAQRLRTGGRLVHYGLLSGQPLLPSLSHQRPDITIDMFRLRTWIHSANKTSITEAFATVFDLIRTGHIQTRIQAELPLGEALSGIRTSLRQASAGKVLLRPQW